MNTDENQIPLGTLSIVQFCKEYGISKATFHNLLKEGRAPGSFKVGARRLIPRQAALEWERKMLAEAEAAGEACHAA